MLWAAIAAQVLAILVSLGAVDTGLSDTLKALVAEHEKTIADQDGQIAALKEQLSGAGDTANKTDNAGEGGKSAKKQQASN